MELDLANPSDTLYTQLVDAALADPGRVFLRFPQRTLTYGGLRDAAALIGTGLARLGVRPGDRVATLMDNCPEMVEMIFSTAHAGAILVPINTANRGTFLSHQLNDSGATVLVASAEHLDRVADVRADLSTVRTVISVGSVPGTSDLAYADLSGAEPTGPAVIEGRDLAMILYTSGTTGASKGCMMSHSYLLHAGYSVATSIERTSEDVQYSCLPLFHMHAISGTVVATLLLRGTSVIGRRFSVTKFWEEIESSGAAIAYVIGPMATLLADAPDTPAMQRCRGQLKLVRGAPFPPTAQQIWRERFGVHEARAGGYGMTEASPVITMPRGAVAPGTSSGRVAHGFELRILEESGRPAAAGVQGEVAVRPLLPHIMFEGYWGREEATAERWRNGWFLTGDLGSVDEDGWFTFGDRLKDSMRRRGENISSVEIENVVREHPAVADVAVHAVPSPLTEDDVKVTAVLAEGAANLEAAELWAWVCARVPDFAKPRYIEFRAEVPRNSVGRILKYELRAQGVTPTTWDCEEADLRAVRT